MTPSQNEVKSKGVPGIRLELPSKVSRRASLTARGVSVSRTVSFDLVKRYLSSKPLRGRRIVSPAEPLVLHRLDCGDRVFSFAEPLQCEMRCEDGLWIIECESIHARAYDTTREGALVALCGEFAMLWDEYALEDDSRLAPDALEIKRRLLELAREEDSK